jgi:hypothetical protein
LQVDVPFVGFTHGAHDVPHVPGSKSGTQAPPQSWYPVSHASPHAPPAQVWCAFGRAAGHPQDVPHVARS